MRDIPSLPFACSTISSVVHQEALASRYYRNPLLQVRGNAGTHDLALGLKTLRTLKNARNIFGNGGQGTSDPILVPRYDKSACGGKGDRAPVEGWAKVAMPPEVVLLEGWMLGFEALPEDSPVLSEVEEGEVLLRFFSSPGGF